MIKRDGSLPYADDEDEDIEEALDRRNSPLHRPARRTRKSRIPGHIPRVMPREKLDVPTFLSRTTTGEMVPSIHNRIGGRDPDTNYITITVDDGDAKGDPMKEAAEATRWDRLPGWRRALPDHGTGNVGGW